MATLEQKLRALHAETETRTRTLPPAQARAVRTAALAQARSLVENRGPELRLVNRSAMLAPPGQTGRRRAGVRW